MYSHRGALFEATVYIIGSVAQLKKTRNKIYNNKYSRWAYRDALPHKLHEPNYIFHFKVWLPLSKFKSLMAEGMKYLAYPFVFLDMCYEMEAWWAELKGQDVAMLMFFLELYEPPASLI